MAGAGIVPFVAAVVFLSVSAAVAHADEHAIAITDEGPVPAEVTVVVGEPVTWTNESSETRTVVTPDQELGSGPLGPGESYGHVFEEPGTWLYFVLGEPRLQGTVIVGPSPENATATRPSSVPAADPTPVVVEVPLNSGGGPALLLAVAVVGVIAVVAAIAGLIGASRRPGR